ncbi:MAG: hypothetical protein KQH63_15395 [Desulfobulbaceae bacterium]|nr:hypothetical protein [Desulfobulbaceae bacterium]
MSSFNAADKGKYYSDNDNDGSYDGGTVDKMCNPFGVQMVPGWPKPGCVNVKPLTQAPVDFAAGPFDFGSTTAFAAKVDNSVAGQMRDCAECHVGGGMMEYIPVSGSTDLSAGTCETRTEFFDSDKDGVAEQYDSNGGVACDASDQGTQICGTYPYTYGTKNFQCIPANSRQELRSATLTGVNTFNYFIDQYDENNDGSIGEVIAQDYNDTGVLEMDCLMCHLDGYSWEDRKEAIRKGRFDASRAQGAGIGVVVDASGDGMIGAGDGNVVSYDAAAISVNSSGELTLGATGLNVHGSTPSENCNSCHGDLHQVDWKKRGDSWTGDYGNDVHAAIGCIGCHDPSVKWAADGTDADHGWRDYMESLNLDGKGSSAVLGHDPAKGNAPYSSLWNKTDNSIVGCAGCHSGAPTAAETFDAADPTAKHEALGLTSIIAQDGRDGVRDISHIELLDCSVCHVRKLGRGPSAVEGGTTHGSLYEWGTGGAMVDSTGTDADGRLTDHENLYVERTMEDNLCYSWQGSKLTARNALVTMFWRDKDDNFANGGDPAYFDVNADGQTGAMDAVNPSHVRDAMAAANLDVLTHDGIIDDAEIAAQQTALANYLADNDADGYSDILGTCMSTSCGNVADWTKGKLKLSFMGVTFKVNHNISPAGTALGKGGCLDCHGAGTVYSGSYDLKPRDLDASWDNTSPTGENKWVVPFTKVNNADYDGDGVVEGGDKGDWQFSDFHPTLFAKGLKGRSIAVTAAKGGADTIRTIDRSELLYEGDSTVTGGPGARTMVDGTVATGRAAIVAALDNVTDAMHNRHVAAGYGKCSTCHDNGAGGLNLSKAGVSDLGSLYAFTVVDDGLGNPLTCSANACHGDNGFSDDVAWELASEVSVTPYLSALADQDYDMVVELNASRSNCDNGCVSYSWDTSGGTVLGEPTDEFGALLYPAGSALVVQYGDTSQHTASITVTDASGEMRATSVSFTPQIVTDPVTGADFTSAVAGNDVTLSATVDASAYRAYIYWGDRSRTISNDPVADLAAGIAHTYNRVGDYRIRVMVLDSLHNRTDYTFNEDGDLEVTIN